MSGVVAMIHGVIMMVMVVMVMVVIMISDSRVWAPANTILQSVPSETITIPIPAFTVETVEPVESFTVSVNPKGRII